MREGRLPATTSHGKRLIDPGALDEVRDEMYPMLSAAARVADA